MTDVKVFVEHQRNKIIKKRLKSNQYGFLFHGFRIYLKFSHSKTLNLTKIWPPTSWWSESKKAEFAHDQHKLWTKWKWSHCYYIRYPKSSSHTKHSHLSKNITSMRKNATGTSRMIAWTLKLRRLPAKTLIIA